MSFLEEQERYSAQGLDYHPSDKGSCSNFNMLSVHCIRYPDKCKQFAEECIKLATGGQDNKYYHTAVVSVRDPRLLNRVLDEIKYKCKVARGSLVLAVFIFLAAILYLAGAIWTLTKEGMEWLGYSTTDDEGHEVSFNQNDLERSLTRNSWKKSKVKLSKVQFSNRFQNAEENKAMLSAL